MRLAITGGTGFVGTNLIAMALGRGHEVRALTRRTVERRPGLQWVEGALDRPASLDRMMMGCEAVIHVAGVINGDDAAFRRGNVAGTEAMVDAAARAGIVRFVHVSSLAAREPKLSAYGRSKCLAEEVVIASGGDWTIVRPPAVYGPRDRELLELFRLARHRIVPVPAGTSLSMLHVDDLCRLLLGVLDRPTSFARTYEADDGRPGGWPADELVRAIGRANGRAVRPIGVSRGFIRRASRIDTLLRRSKAKLTRDRADYYAHPDWVISAAARPPDEIWRPYIDTTEGLADTAAWYVGAGLLKA